MHSYHDDATDLAVDCLTIDAYAETTTAVQTENGTLDTNTYSSTQPRKAHLARGEFTQQPGVGVRILGTVATILQRRRTPTNISY